MSNKQLLTIAIPTYNRGAILYENVKRMLRNNYSDLELIISDNNSTDNTKELISSINDQRIKYYKNEKNIGIAKNINKVLSLAKGKYIYLISDEDYIPVKGLNRILNIIRDNEYSLILGKILSENNNVYYNRKDGVYKKGYESKTKLSFSHPYISGIIYKKSVILPFISNKYNKFIYPHEILISYSLLNGDNDAFFINDTICIQGKIQKSHIEEINGKKFNHPYNRIDQFLFKKKFVTQEYIDENIKKKVIKKLEKSMGIGLAVIIFRGFSLKMLFNSIRRVNQIHDYEINKWYIYYSFLIYVPVQMKSTMIIFVKTKMIFAYKIYKLIKNNGK